MKNKRVWDVDIFPFYFKESERDETCVAGIPTGSQGRLGQHELL